MTDPDMNLSTRPARATLKQAERTAMYFSSCRGKRLGTRVGASKTKNLMSRVDQLPDNGGTDKTCCACNENTHVKTPFHVH
jgi:hypothetical protein